MNVFDSCWRWISSVFVSPAPSLELERRVRFRMLHSQARRAKGKKQYLLAQRIAALLLTILESSKRGIVRAASCRKRALENLIWACDHRKYGRRRTAARLQKRALAYLRRGFRYLR